MTGISNYGVSLICRNERKNIENCIESILNQNIKPEIIVIIDDASTDGTFEILKRYAKTHSDIFTAQIHIPRYKAKGLNISIAINQSMKHLLSIKKTRYVLRMDADVILTDKRYVEKLLKILEKNCKTGIISGVSDVGYEMQRHLADAARIYRLECLRDILRTSPNTGYPIMYGHDSFTIFRAKWLGWKVKRVDITFHDARPYRRSINRWFLSGRFSYANGSPMFHQIFSLLNNMFHEPYLVGSLIAFISYLLHHLLTIKIYEDSYYAFMKKDLMNYTLIRIRGIISKVLDR